MTYGQIETLFGLMTGDTGRVFFTAAQRLAWSQDAVREACRRSGACESRLTILSVAGQQEYDLPDDCDQALRVAYDGKVLSPTLQSLLRSSNPSWANYSGSPSMYYVDELNQKFGIYFKPAVSTNLTVYSGENGIPLTAQSGTLPGEYGIVVDALDASTGNFGYSLGDTVVSVSNYDIELFYQATAKTWGAADTPPIPAWSHGLILFWMLSKAYESDGPMQDMARAALWSELAERQINRLGVRAKCRLPKTYQRVIDGGIAYEPRVKDRFLGNATE